jgi:hypothetical protein
MLSDFASGQDDSTQCRHCGVTVATHLLSCPACGASRSDPLGWYPPMATSASARLPAPKASVQTQLAAPAAWNTAAGIADDEFYATHNPWREPKSSHKVWFMAAGGLLLVSVVTGAYLLLRPERVVPKAAFGSVTTQQATTFAASSSRSAVMAGTGQPAGSLPSGQKAGAAPNVVAPPKLVEAGPDNHKLGDAKEAVLKPAETGSGESGSVASKPEVQSLAAQTGPQARVIAPAPLVGKSVATETGGVASGPSAAVQAGAAIKPSVSTQAGMANGPSVSNQASVAAKPSASNQAGVANGPSVSNQASVAANPSASNQAGVANGPSVANQSSVAAKPSASNQVGVANAPSVSNQASVAAKPSVSNHADIANAPSVSNQASVVAKPSASNQAGVANAPSVSNQTSAAAKPSASSQAGVANGPPVSNQVSALAKPSVSNQAVVTAVPSVSRQPNATAKPAVPTQAAVAAMPSVSNQVSAASRPSVTNQAAAATGPSVATQASATSKLSASNQATAVVGPLASNQGSAATKPTVSRQGSVPSSAIVASKQSTSPQPAVSKSREVAAAASRTSTSSPPPTVVAKRDAKTSADVNRNLQMARAMLARDDVSAARSHLTTAIAAQPKNLDALSLDETTSAREQQRDAVLQAARNCESSGRWICAWHNAGTAMVIDSGSADAKRILSHAMQEAEAAKTPAPAPVVEPPQKLPYHH